MGIDSAKLVSGFEELTAYFLKEQPLSAYPWHARADGDVWWTFAVCLKARGVQLVRVVKAKGHAENSDVLEGLTTTADELGSDNAGALAAISSALIPGE